MQGGDIKSAFLSPSAKIPAWTITLLGNMNNGETDNTARTLFGENESEKQCPVLHVECNGLCTQFVRGTFILIMYEWLKVYGFRTPKRTPHNKYTAGIKTRRYFKCGKCQHARVWCGIMDQRWVWTFLWLSL